MLQISQNKKVCTEQLYFLAEANKELYKDAHLITAKSAYVGIIEGQLIERMFKGEIDVTPIDPGWQWWIKDAVKRNAFDKKFYVHEYVDVQPTHITVCLNKDIVDDEFIDTSIQQISEALDKLDGTYGKVIFSKKLFFTVKDIPWLNTH